MTPFKRIFFSLYMAVFLSSLGLGILSPILPVYVDRLAASSFILGVVFGAYPAARTVFMPFIGRLSDRVGWRPFIFLGLALFTAVSPLYALSHTIFQLTLVRFLQGLAAAMLLPVAMSAIGKLSPQGREGFVMGSFTSAFFAGLGFGPLIGGFLKDVYSIEAAFYGMGALALLALLVTLFMLRSAPSGPVRVPSGTRLHNPWRIARDGPLMGLLLFRFARAVGIGLMWVIMPLYAARDLGISAFHVGILLSANTFLTTLLQAPFGYLADRFGHVRSLTAGSFLAAFAIALTGFSTSFLHLLAISLALGVSGSLIVPSGSALAVSLGRTRGMGSVMGLFNSSLSFGTMIGPAVGGLLLDLSGVRLVFPAGAVLGLLGLLCLHLMYNKTVIRDS
jgi:MFS family permease